MTLTLSKTKDFKKQLKKRFVSKGSDRLKIEITPYRDWRVVVVVFFSGLIASFGFSAYMFIQINQDSFFTLVKKTPAGSTLNRAGLTEVNRKFTESAERFQKVVNERITVVDPSL